MVPVQVRHEHGADLARVQAAPPQRGERGRAAVKEHGAIRRGRVGGGGGGGGRWWSRPGTGPAPERVAGTGEARRVPGGSGLSHQTSPGRRAGTPRPAPWSAARPPAPPGGRRPACPPSGIGCPQRSSRTCPASTPRGVSRPACAAGPRRRRTGARSRAPGAGRSSCPPPVWRCRARVRSGGGRPAQADRLQRKAVRRAGIGRPRRASWACSSSMIDRNPPNSSSGNSEP